MKHAGEIVENAVRNSGITLSKLSKRIGRSRQYLYNIFESNKIDWEVIESIGSIIHHDFYIDFNKTKLNNKQNEMDTLKQTLDNCKKENEMLRELIAHQKKIIDMFDKREKK